ncbi:MAG: preprotein translocase subunit SecG [Flavobacteriales bacterium]|nr:preprotein translocase subunit SecG [Flavobacteriales bacterium]
MTILYTLFTVLIVITCILLILIVLVQNPKGGGLSSAFGGGNQIMGARKTSDFLEKATWFLAIVLVVLALSSTFAIPKSGESGEQESIQDVRPESNEEDIFENLDIQEEIEN